MQVFAQSAAQDSLSFAKALDNTLVIYYHSVGDQSRLYNGTEYTGYPFSFTEGSPFFMTNQPEQSSIVYDQVEYNGVGLIYDNLSDRVIMQDENHRIQLSNERISRFTIGNYPFIRIVRDNPSKAEPATGFYNVLHEGKLTVLKKEIKTIQQVYSYSESTRIIDTKINYYLRKNGQWARVNSQKELLSIFPEKKKDIQHYIKSNKLNFKKDTDNLLKQVAVYYEQQTK